MKNKHQKQNPLHKPQQNPQKNPGQPGQPQFKPKHNNPKNPRHGQ